LSTAEQVLHKAAAERGAFDATCLDQLKDAFTATIAKYDEQLAAGAPAKAERAAAVAQAEATHQATQARQADIKEKAAAAKEEKVAADAETKSAAKSLHVQMFRRSQVRSWRNHYLHVHCFWCWNEKHQSNQPRVFGHQCRCQLETVVFGRDALDML
jgi:hypothetical protein